MLSAIKRGLRNLGRNLPRTLLVSLILGLAVALALIVFAVEEGIGKELGEIEIEVGTLIEVRPVDSFGPRVEEPMDANILKEINLISGIRRVTPYLLAQLPLAESVLDDIAATGITIDGSSSQGSAGRGMRRYFAFGIGLEDSGGGEEPLSYGGGTADIIEGRNLNEDDIGKRVAIIAADIAAASGLGVDSILPLNEDENGNEETIQIVGIYESSSRLLSRGVFMSYETVRELWGEENELHQIAILADTIQTVDEVTAELRLLLGEDVDVVAYKDIATGHLDERIDSMQSVLQLVLVISLILVGVVVMATMVLIVRERSSEVGILKALGAFRKDIVTQFGAEALFLGICGYIWGFLFYIFGGSFMGNLLVNLNAAEEASHRGGGMISREGVISTSLGMGTVEATLSPETALYVFGAVIVIGLTGGILPGLYASYFKPAEVLRRG